MADIIAILIRGRLTNLAQIIIFDVNTLYMRGYSFMLLLMAADSSKVLKKSIAVSNGLDPDQDQTVCKVYQQMTKVALSMINL